MKLTITIDTGTPAFAWPDREAAFILKKLSEEMARDGIRPRPLYDGNGVECGAVTVERERVAC